MDVHTYHQMVQGFYSNDVSYEIFYKRISNALSYANSTFLNVKILFPTLYSNTPCHTIGKSVDKTI